MKKWNDLFRFTNMVMKAYVVGLYTTKDRKSDKCEHVSCGYRRPNYAKQCGPADYFYYLVSPRSDYWAVSWPNKTTVLNHKQTGCKSDWCVVEHGQRPSLLVKCARTYFKRYSDEELANPNTKPGIVAVGVDIASWGHDSNYGLIALYDMVNDRWYNDDWWMQVHQTGDLMPHNQSLPTGLKPSIVNGIDLVVQKMKESL